MKLALMLSATLVANNAFAEGPAVSGPNGKFSVEGGAFDGDSSFLALGSYSIPLAPSIGFQVDGAVGSIDGETMGGGGAHLFTRDPSQYLFGIYGSYHTWDSIDIWRVAVEAELYLGRFSLTGIAGFEGVDVPTTSGGLVVLTQDDEHAFTHIDLAYYPTDNFKISGGYRYLNEVSFASAGAEFLFDAGDVPMSLFARGDFGDDDYTAVTGGLKIYLGADRNKSLIQRHRTDDPDNYTPVFPKLVTEKPGSGETPICAVNGSVGGVPVTSPANGECTCPSGTGLEGSPPNNAGGGTFLCFGVPT
ncbi:hypothetical protein [Hyphomicrobium sp. LHD-15]|uniref:hypothetical protein n=1 Tax=Hyphomicrobium sp. LHD-15 TaxID=3072142 RepID=UPI00280E6C91|nr:hypothetical protein [Hyphomicrobium sp. LHD-15]MDQ8699850.1 hypothetical protein [Hyphomicrobium sp. LHD-15]